MGNVTSDLLGRSLARFWEDGDVETTHMDAGLSKSPPEPRGLTLNHKVMTTCGSSASSELTSIVVSALETFLFLTHSAGAKTVHVQPMTFCGNTYVYGDISGCPTASVASSKK